MGMTIDDAIETLLAIRSCGAPNIAKSVAINTMRKYQKIEEIYSDYLDDMDAEKLADKLGEVF